MSKGRNEYHFHVELLASIRVRADGVAEAREKLKKAIDDCESGNFGAWPGTGEPITGEVFLSDGPDDEVITCQEIDGEPPCYECGEVVDLDGYDGLCGNCADAEENENERS